MVVVLDVSPTLAVRVRSVVEVADVARAPFFLLPAGLGDAAGPAEPGRDAPQGAALPGAHRRVAAPARSVPGATAGAPRPVHLMESPPERALVFESQGRLFGLPLTLGVPGGHPG